MFLSYQKKTIFALFLPEFFKKSTHPDAEHRGIQNKKVGV
jgi:hypothetical protein